MTTRRGFWWTCGASGAAILLARTGLIELPKAMVLQAAGACSFCGQGRAEVAGMAGVVGRQERVCDECTGCFEVVVEEMEKQERARLATPSPRPRPVVRDFHCSFCDRSGRDVRKLISGPWVFICDGCTGDAGGLFAASGSRFTRAA